MASITADAEAYMREIVDPTIADFHAHPTSRRHAFLACVATYHCIDYIKRPPGNLRKQFRDECPDFGTVDRVAHAFKHTVTDGQKPLKVTSVFERPPAGAGVAQCGLSRVGDSIGGVEVWNESESDLIGAVTKAAEFLRGEISRRGKSRT
ncbi:hypothetical protein [Bradyrhizobium sp. USDA 10063]